jgi:pyruvate/2-oxoglutarate dehydrogenase complex dihydrolipoamide dehydrogenase (E3) component
MKAATFYGVSQLGMLAGTVVYVNAGTQLGQLKSLQGIVSPGLLLSFALLGIFPLLAKKIVDVVKARRVYAPWAARRPKTYDRNMVVIGAGAAGLVTAYIAAAVKAKVTLVEAAQDGWRLPELRLRAQQGLDQDRHLVRQMRHSADYGVAQASWTLDFAQVMERVAHVVREIEPHDSVERYTGLGVDVQQGSARILDPWHVQITAADGVCRRCPRAASSWPPARGPSCRRCRGWKTAATSPATPCGACANCHRAWWCWVAGPSAVSWRRALRAWARQVTQVEMAHRLMLREDEDVSAYALQALQADGVQVLTGHKALRCERQGSDKFLVVDAGGTEKRIAFDVLLCAVGRVARLQGFGLEELGMPVQRTITTNEYLQTNFPNILAAGDVAGPYQFTHTAAHQAWYAAVNGLFGMFRKFKADYSVIPWCTFIDPEVARVGLNEQEAREKGIAFEVTRYGIDDLDRAIADSAAHGWVKVLTVPGKDRILGVTIVGVHAGDLLAEYVLAMKHGLGLNKILGTIHTYPTWAEANKYAAGEWKRAHQPLACCAGWNDSMPGVAASLALGRRLAGADGGRQQPGHGLARGHAAAAEATGHALHAGARARARRLRVEADGSYGNLVHGFARRPCRPRWPGRGACRQPSRRQRPAQQGRRRRRPQGLHEL